MNRTLKCVGVTILTIVNAWFHKFLISPTIVEIHCSCDKVDHKQEVRFLLYILGQIFTWQYIPNPLD